MARRERLHGILNLARASRTDVGTIHDRFETTAANSACTGFRYDRLADREEMWTIAADRLLEDDLEEIARDERVGEAEDPRGDIVEAADARVDLAQENDGDGDEGAQETGSQGREDRRHVRVGKTRIDDIT